MNEVKQFILDRYLRGEDPARLTPKTPLLTSGIIDSIGTLEVLQFIERRLGIEFHADEVDRHQLDTLEGIERLIRRKLRGHP
jgi:acyl carrier protein